MKRRNTASTQEVLGVLTANDQAMSQDMVMAEIENVDRATVYRVLNRFYEDGIVHRIVGDDGKQYFALCTTCHTEHNHNHFHFRCEKCGKVECLEIEINVSVPAGYLALNYNGIISGICNMCS